MATAKSFGQRRSCLHIYRRLDILDCEQAFGYETKFKREELGLPKVIKMMRLQLLVVCQNQNDLLNLDGDTSSKSALEQSRRQIY